MNDKVIWLKFSLSLTLLLIYKNLTIGLNVLKIQLNNANI